MIFYLSGTGNTLWAAKLIAEATDDKLVSIADVIETNYCFKPTLSERIGFCFPVHGWRPPKIVRRFVQNLKISDFSGHYCYALCSAGDTVGEAMDIFQADIAKVGLHADSVFSIIMPESYVGLPFMDVDKPSREKLKKQKAEADMKIIANEIKENKKGIERLVIGNWPRINSRVLGDVFVKKIVTDKPFHVDSNKCVKCGICYDVCPVHNIIGGLGHEPQWKHNDSCLSCFACYHHCPHHAIEYGNRTKNKGQYFFNKI